MGSVLGKKKTGSYDVAKIEGFRRAIKINYWRIAHVTSNERYWYTEENLADDTKVHRAFILQKIFNSKNCIQEVSFVALKSMKNLKMVQKIYFKDKVLEMVSHKFGDVKAKENYSRIIALHACSSAARLSPSQLNGKIRVETEWYTDKELILVFHIIPLFY